MTTGRFTQHPRTGFLGAAAGLLALSALAGCLGGNHVDGAGEDPAGAPAQVGQSVTGSAECVGLNAPGCTRVYDCVEPGTAAPPGASNVATVAGPAAAFCPTDTRAGGVTPACNPVTGAQYTLGASALPWIDACAAPGRAVLLANTDDSVATAALPFPFAFYGATRAAVQVASNGVLAFGAAPALWANQPLPYDGATDAVFAFWDDLQLRSGGVCVATVGTAPSRRFVAQWNDAALYGPNGTAAHLTFEVVLSESTQAIDVLYRAMQMEGNPTRATGGGATIGLQQGPGVTYELLGFNTPDVARGNTGFRWTPTGGVACGRGTWSRVFDGQCASATGVHLPVWSTFRYAAQAPPGTMIAFEARASDTLAGLATAPAVQLPVAPVGLSGVAPAVDLGASLRARAHGMETRRFVQVTATLEGSVDGSTRPVLGALEAQFVCTPNEYLYDCRDAAPCAPSAVCRRGAVACTASVPACVVTGLQPAGTPCGSRMVCAPDGACVPCTEGEACTTEGGCGVGRISCTTGAPVCVVSATRPAGAACGAAPDDYLRTAPIFEWYDACRAPGAVRYLVDADDAAVTVDLPFAFRYYGTPYARVGVGSNGVVSFGGAPNPWLNTPLPTPFAGNSVFPYWDDLVTRGGVCVATFDAAPRRRFVVQWDNARFNDTRGESTNLDFEVILSEASQSIDVFYKRLDGFGDRAQGSSATVGLQRGTGDQHDMVSYNVAYTIARDTGFRWVPVLRTRCDAAGRCR